MLPSSLLRARVSKGKLYPKYVKLDSNSLVLAEIMVKAYENSVGEKKAVVLQKLRDIESQEPDYKLVRGLVELLERRCIYTVESAMSPTYARDLVFKEAGRTEAITSSERAMVIQSVARRLHIPASELEESLWKDLEEEQILKSFQTIDQMSLIRRYNFSLAQTALFKSTRMEFTANRNWKNIFRDIKRLGLMYLIERDQDARESEAGLNTDEEEKDEYERNRLERHVNSENYTVSLDGPLSLFKMTDRYGTSFAKLLDEISQSDSWSFKAELLDRIRNRILYFEETSASVLGLFEVNRSDFDMKRESATVPNSTRVIQQQHARIYDSKVEERFARKFNSLNTGWVLKREPEPLKVGRHVLIPDFSIRKGDLKAYLEIVGFWTKEYLERKIAKLSSLPPNVDIIIAVDRNLACSPGRFDRLATRTKNTLLLFYSREVQLGPILGHLKMLEDVLTQREVKSLRGERFELNGEIISIKSLADGRGVSIQSVRETLPLLQLDGYRIVGDHLVSLSKILKIGEKLKASGPNLWLSEAVRIIEAEGLDNSYQILETLGYAVIWDGLDYERARVTIAVGTVSTAATHDQ